MALAACRRHPQVHVRLRLLHRRHHRPGLHPRAGFKLCSLEPKRLFRDATVRALYLGSIPEEGRAAMHVTDDRLEVGSALEP